MYMIQMGDQNIGVETGNISKSVAYFEMIDTSFSSRCPPKKGWEITLREHFDQAQ